MCTFTVGGVPWTACIVEVYLQHSAGFRVSSVSYNPIKFYKLFLALSYKIL